MFGNVYEWCLDNFRYDCGMSIVGYDAVDFVGPVSDVPKTADQILTELRKTGREAELTEVLEGLMELCLEGKAMQIAGSFARTAK